jgi:sulfonate transport system permease protein
MVMRSSTSVPISYLKAVLWSALFLGCWEVAGRVHVTGVRVFPPVSGIVIDYLDSWDVYLGHILATVQTASLGLLIGTVCAGFAAIVFCFVPTIERLFHGVNITLFSVPTIALGPLLVLILGGRWPQIALASTMVYFPTMAAMLVGLRDVDPRHLDIVRAYGGGTLAVMRIVRLRSAVPGILAGLRVAASVSVLGAILGEFGSGERWGLGTFLLGSLGQSNANRLWGISIAAAAVALAGYAFFAVMGARFTGSTTQVTMAASRVPEQMTWSASRGKFEDYIVIAASVALPFLIWSGGLWLIDLSPIVAPGPLDTLSYLFLSSGSAGSLSRLLAALSQTLPLAALGMVVGLAVAFVLAALSVVAPGMLKVVLPVSMVLQSTPLVALTPIVLLLLGRSMFASMAMAVLVVFFPAFVLLVQGFALVPRAALETVQVYGASRMQQLRLISVPYSLDYLFAAAKLVAPRALLGVMVAEWLITGTGLGNLMDVSRGTFDYGMVWSGAVVSIMISVLAYHAITMMERRVR